MDKRVEKSKKALRAAFMQLRAKKDLHNIKITELCQVADVNKTTFYSHYRDIYDLSEDVEKDLLYSIIQRIPRDTDYTFNNPSSFTREISLALDHYSDELRTLFSGSESSHLGMYLEQTLKQVIFNRYPYLKDNRRMNILLSYCIQGAYGARMNNLDLSIDEVLDVVEGIVCAIQPLMNIDA